MNKKPRRKKDHKVAFFVFIYPDEGDQAFKTKLGALSFVDTFNKEAEEKDCDGSHEKQIAKYMGAGIVPAEDYEDLSD